MIETIYSTELYHHGVKGMKWGVRRYQNEDGTLTAKGKQRQKDSKPKAIDKYYEEYKQLGYSDKDAKQAAKGKLATRNALIAIGAVAAVSVAAIAVYKYRDYAKDRVLAPDRVLETVHTGDIAERIKPGNPFYATYDSRDKKIYASSVFGHFSKESNITKFMAKDGLKVASEKSGRKVFEDLMANDKDFNSMVRSTGRVRPSDSPKESYRIFNYGLVYRGGTNERINQKFYDALRSQGYGAVLDMNDKHIEDWTFNPMIVFDTTPKRIVSTTKASSKELGIARYATAMAYMQEKQILEHPINEYTISLGAAYCAATGMYISDHNDVSSKSKAIRDYKREHPGTSLSNKEILKNKGYIEPELYNVKN